MQLYTSRNFTEVQWKPHKDWGTRRTVMVHDTYTAAEFLQSQMSYHLQADSV